MESINQNQNQEIDYYLLYHCVLILFHDIIALLQVLLGLKPQQNLQLGDIGLWPLNPLGSADALAELFSFYLALQDKNPNIVNHNL